MMKTEISALNHTLEETEAWLEDLVERGPFENEKQAYSHLRAVLHSLRDRLTVEEAVHLAAQVPMLVRGFYYEGWRPALAPNEEQDRSEFFDIIRESLDAQAATDQDLQASTRAVFDLLAARLPEGQINHVRTQLPEELQGLWS